MSSRPRDFTGRRISFCERLRRPTPPRGCSLSKQWVMRNAELKGDRGTVLLREALRKCNSVAFLAERLGGKHADAVAAAPRKRNARKYVQQKEPSLLSQSCVASFIPHMWMLAVQSIPNSELIITHYALRIERDKVTVLLSRYCPIS